MADDLWVTVPNDERLYRLNLEGDIVAELRLPPGYCTGGCQGLAWDGESLWLPSGRTVHELDPTSGQESTAFEVDLDSIASIVWDGQALLMIDGEGNLVRYDRAGQRLRRLAVGTPFGGVTGMAWVEGELWVEGTFGTLLRFDSGFAEIGSLNLGQCVEGVAFYHLALYWDGATLWLVDPESNRLSQCAPPE